ncbi:MAG TPA: nucleotidyltransferase domain-containing protein [Chitinophagaceae bacterium]|nr:nucleotidyltransferase domain-containing protein [Chitinophagaceae bacterium]
MEQEIHEEILKLEKANDIKVLLAVESGSRAWGFASTNSDWDVRFIYVHKYDWYLSVEEKKDNIEYILANDIDLAGWELRKALLLFRKSNPPLLEWLRSSVIYKESLATAAKLRAAVPEYFNPKSCLYHYFNMARNNYEAYFKQDEARLKKYFYVLRPLLACNWIERTDDMPPIEFDILVKEEINDPLLKAEINDLLIQKKNGEELDVAPRIPIIDAFIENRIAHFEQYLKEYQFTNAPGYSTLNNIFRTTLEEAWK